MTSVIPNNEPVLDVHRGAIDSTTITTQPPTIVMNKMKSILINMGVQVYCEGTCKYRCIRPARSTQPTSPTGDGQSEGTPEDSSAALESTPGASLTGAGGPTTLYGPNTSEDPGDEVRFSIELTRLEGLQDTYSLDIRRLKGNLRSYKYVYCTVRDRFTEVR